MNTALPDQQLAIEQEIYQDVMHCRLQQALTVIGLLCQSGGPKAKAEDLESDHSDVKGHQTKCMHACLALPRSNALVLARGGVGMVSQK